MPILPTLRTNHITRTQTCDVVETSAPVASDIIKWPFWQYETTPPNKCAFELTFRHTYHFNIENADKSRGHLC